MKQVLIICGPTATGKTALAVKLAKKFPAQLISADSRQVYQGMDIVTGKDKPKGVTIHGLDLVRPDQEFSVAHFVKFAHPLINPPAGGPAGGLPILVGGTGQYLDSLINPPQTLTIPPNLVLRKNLAKKSVKQLQQQLVKLNPARFQAMNHSDQLNPRRLIRAIEVASSLQGPTLKAKSEYDVLWLGLTTNKTTLDKRISARVKARVKAGAIGEWQQLKAKYSSHLPSMSSLGYRELPDISQWIKAEQQYSRRQLTWFKKNKAIRWFDINSPKFFDQVVNLIQTWYTK